MQYAPFVLRSGWRTVPGHVSNLAVVGQTSAWADEVFVPAGASGLTESMDWVLSSVLPGQAGCLPGDPFIAGPAWFGELALHLGQICGLSEADCVPIAVAFELAAASMLSDDGRAPMGAVEGPHVVMVGQTALAFRPAPWRLELLRDYVQALPGKVSTSASSVARFAMDRWLIERCVWLVHECLLNSAASVPAFRFNQAIAAGSALGASLALGFQAVAPRAWHSSDDDDLVAYGESAAAQAVNTIIYEIIRSRLAAAQVDDITLARVSAAVLEQARMQRDYRKVVTSRAAARIGTDLSSLQWLQNRWESELRHVWNVMEADFSIHSHGAA